MQPSNAFGDALAIHESVNASKASKNAVGIGLRNSYGDYVLAGLYGQSIPPYMSTGIASFRASINSGKFDGLLGAKVPRRFGLGDIMILLDEKRADELDVWTLERLQKVVPAWHDAEARLQLERFYRTYVHDHVIVPETWTEAMTAMLLIILYSVEMPEQRVHKWFGSVLGQGIAASLQRYQLDVLARSMSGQMGAMPYDPMLTVSILRAVGSPPGIIAF